MAPVLALHAEIKRLLRSGLWCCPCTLLGKLLKGISPTVSSFHTKYRPTNFDEVLGQGPIIKSLKRVVKDGRNKAFLFVGPAGTGKTTLARIVANQFIGSSGSVVNLEEVDGA